MNKYITALLVALTATGVEAQTYRSAIEVALGNCTPEELYNKAEFQDIKTEILSVIEAYKNIEDEKWKESPTCLFTIFNKEKFDKDFHFTPLNYDNKFYTLHPSICSSVIIRAPGRTK